MSKNDGGAAFLVDADFSEDGISRTRRHGGLSVRDYFAAQAMAALVTSGAATPPYELDDPEQARSVAYLAYCAADAMLNERKAPDAEEQRPTAHRRGALALDPPAQRHVKRATRGKKSSSSSSPHK